MTDSGSFDSGDVVALADLDALLARVDGTCSAAGVAGSGLAAGYFAANRVVNGASAWQAVVAAYRRAWEASLNRPGTEQAAPAAGDALAGALFQNLWTQLGQMDFPLPSSAESFVCAFDDPSPGTDESGAGGGLSGSDLVLAQSGSVPGAVGTPPYRQLTLASAQTFSIPVNTQNVISGASAWTVLMHVSGLATDGNGLLLAWNGAADLTKPAFRRDGSGSLMFGAWPGMSAGQATADDPGTADSVYVAVWCDGVSNTRAGFAIGSRPTRWSDFAATRRVAGSSIGTGPAASSPGLIGRRNGAEYVTARLHSLVVSRTCLIDNNA